MIYTVQNKFVNQRDVKNFLMKINRNAKQRLNVVFWDNLSAHKAKSVKKFLSNSKKIKAVLNLCYNSSCNGQEFCFSNIRKHQRRLLLEMKIQKEIIDLGKVVETAINMTSAETYRNFVFKGEGCLGLLSPGPSDMTKNKKKTQSQSICQYQCLEPCENKIRNRLT